MESSESSGLSNRSSTEGRERALNENEKHFQAFWDDSEQFRDFKREMGKGGHVTGAAAKEMWSSTVHNAIQKSSDA